MILNTSVSTLRRRYLQHKIIDLKLQDPVPPEGLQLPGATVLKTSTYGAKLQVDTAITGIDAVIGALVASTRWPTSPSRTRRWSRSSRRSTRSPPRADRAARCRAAAGRREVTP